MGATASLFEMPSEIFERLQKAKLYTTWEFLQENPYLNESDLYLKSLSISRAYHELDTVFKVKGSPLKFIIEGDYHHPAGIEQGIDPEGYFYEGFVSPATVKSISLLLDGYSQEIILNELERQRLVYGDTYTKKLLDVFHRVFEFYREAAERNNAIEVMLA